MAYNVTGLAAYTKQNVDLLVKNSVFEARTQKEILALGNVRVGVKSSEAIGRMDTDVFFQDDSACGFNASGTTTFTQRTLTVGKVKVNEILCDKDLEPYYTQQKLKAGGEYTTAAFAADYSDQKAKKIAEAIEVALWTANSTGSAGTNGLLNKFDGIKTLITAAGGSVVNANTTGFYGTPATTINSATIAKNAVLAVIRALPAKIQGKDDVRIFCGWTTFSYLIQAYVDQNLFHFAPDAKWDENNAVFTIPGSNYKIIPVHGLDSADADACIYAFRMSNIFLGTDLLDEENKFWIRWSEDDENIKFTARMKVGIQLAFVDEIVKFEA
jgi:hypothetical protein